MTAFVSKVLPPNFKRVPTPVFVTDFKRTSGVLMDMALTDLKKTRQAVHVDLLTHEAPSATRACQQLQQQQAALPDFFQSTKHLYIFRYTKTRHTRR